ncbi:MAG TPA: hypothetical protein PKN50_17575 [Spirochaetota bacterium]|nr:hypothetical protein [Spirochaetota bacterium]HPV41745.1 hypothetical protein [Spirochaetota bacterium]
MSAQETWEGMVRVDANVSDRELVPYHLEDPEEMIEFLDDESETMAMGRDSVRRENESELMGTYLH